jgi:hypothetical protein
MKHLLLPLLAASLTLLMACYRNQKPVVHPEFKPVPEVKREEDSFTLLDSSFKLAEISLSYQTAYTMELQANIDYLRTDHKKYERLYYEHQKERVRLAKEANRLDIWIRSHRK